MNWLRDSVRSTYGVALLFEKWGEKLLGLIVCMLPLVFLIAPGSTFYVDWFNHLWLIEYFGEYLRHHLFPPDVLNTTTLIGIPMPLFYSGKFYVLAGVISALVGSALAFRALACVTLFIQFWHIQRAMRVVTNERSLPLLVATLFTWSIYPLTNLYNRSALTEFIAIAFLTSAVASFFVLVVHLSNNRRSAYDAISFGLFYTLAAVTHPLTALFGGIYLLVVGLPPIIILRKRWLFCVIMFSAILTGLVLSPWAYVLHRYSRWLPVNDPSVNQKSFHEAGFFPGSIDNFWSRISPVAVDQRSIARGIGVATPYLDAQVLLPLIVLAVGYAWLSRKTRTGRAGTALMVLTSIFWSSAGLFLLFFAVSVNPELSTYFAGLFDILQSPYRLVSYINLAALTAFLALAGMIDWKAFKRIPSNGHAIALLTVVCLCMSIGGLVTKLIHAAAIRCWDPFVEFRQVNHLEPLASGSDLPRNWQPGLLGRGPQLMILPTTFYAEFYYSVTQGFATKQPANAEDQTRILFVPANEANFGSVSPVKIELAKSAFVLTNVQPFPWNRLLIDGKREPLSRIVTTSWDLFPTWMHPSVEAVVLPPGKHMLEYRFVPTGIWRILDVASWIVLLGWILTLMAFASRGLLPMKVTFGT